MWDQVGVQLDWGGGQHIAELGQYIAGLGQWQGSTCLYRPTYGMWPDPGM